VGHVLTFEPGSAEGLVPYENTNADASAEVNDEWNRVDFYASMVPQGNVSGSFSVNVQAPGGSGNYDIQFFDHFDYFYFRVLKNPINY
jgi:hypothetical protein